MIEPYHNLKNFVEFVCHNFCKIGPKNRELNSVKKKKLPAPLKTPTFIYELKKNFFVTI